MEDIEALSCVWRAGRSKAKTDHSAILFNVNPKINYTPKDIDENHGHAAGLAKKLKLKQTAGYSQR